MSEQLGDLIQTAAGIGQVAAERVPQLMRAHRRVQSRSPGGRGDQRVDRVRSHRRTDRRAEQVDQHEVGLAGPGDRRRSNS